MNLLSRVRTLLFGAEGGQEELDLNFDKLHNTENITRLDLDVDASIPMSNSSSSNSVYTGGGDDE